MSRQPAHRWCGLVLMLIACATPQATPTGSIERAQEAPVDSNDPLAGCSCEVLQAPVRLPSTPEHARWERAAIALDALEQDLEPVFADGACDATTGDALERVLALHAVAIRENRALKIASCDHFARWRFERRDDRDFVEQLGQALRSGQCRFSKSATTALVELTITRTCTMTS